MFNFEADGTINRPVSESMTADEIELRMRCLELALRSPAILRESVNDSDPVAEASRFYAFATTGASAGKAPADA